MERLRGKLRGDVQSDVPVTEKGKYEKLLKSTASIESRTLDVLIEGFEASAGNFDQFHSDMNGREKLLFKNYIDSMRGTDL
jgi:hypothetical protein